MPRIASADVLFVALLLAGAGCCPSDHQTGQSVQRADVALARVPPPATTRPAAEPPVGVLGLPLGTVARIRAVVVAGRDLHDKGHSAQFLLRVTEVNGRELADQPLCEFGVPAFLRKNLARTHDELYEMKHGKKAGELSGKQMEALERGYVGREFTLDAYETGGFSGIPKNMPDDVMQWQDRGFGFHTSLVVLAER
jgi:hypothetical protein